MSGIIVDLFAGGGGASTGIKNALGVDPHIAINHDAAAIAMHQANHPGSQHFKCDIRGVDPRAACAGRDVALLWASPDCRHFSRAKGGAPVSDSVRSLPWVIPRWLDAVRPRVFKMENVEQMRTWGPLVNGELDPDRKGETFRRWIRRIEKIGYHVELRKLSAHHYGAPTTRERLFVIGRCDGEPITWPRATHGPGLLTPRSAAECIDWTIPCPSIFEREVELEDATKRRIARGITKYVLEDPAPFVVPLTHGGDAFRGRSVTEPFATVTGANRGELALIAPALVQVSWGEREGQAPRCMDPRLPLGTAPAGGIKHAVAVAHLMQAYGGNYKGAGRSLELPLPTVTTRDHNHVVRADLAPMGGDVPPRAHAAYAFLHRYNGTSIGQSLRLPLSTIDTRDRFALIIVTIRGVDYVVVDIGYRLLTPRELFNAQGFPPDYDITPRVNGRPITKTAQVKCAGNSVCPPLAEALVRANVERSWIRRAA